jgi:hypothetical protein
MLSSFSLPESLLTSLFIYLSFLPLDAFEGGDLTEFYVDLGDVKIFSAPFLGYSLDGVGVAKQTWCYF